MSRRPLALDDYGIGRELYNELRWFCRQHPDKVEKIKAAREGFNDLGLTGMPRGNGVADPTHTRAMRAMSMSKDVECIEQAAIEADADIYLHVIHNVTRGTRYEDMPVPCGINQFYRARRRFFWCLARRLGKIGD